MGSGRPARPRRAGHARPHAAAGHPLVGPRAAQRTSRAARSDQPARRSPAHRATAVRRHPGPAGTPCRRPGHRAQPLATPTAAAHWPHHRSHRAPPRRAQPAPSRRPPAPLLSAHRRGRPRRRSDTASIDQRPARAHVLPLGRAPAKTRHRCRHPTRAPRRRGAHRARLPPHRHRLATRRRRWRSPRPPANTARRPAPGHRLRRPPADRRRSPVARLGGPRALPSLAAARHVHPRRTAPLGRARRRHRTPRTPHRPRFLRAAAGRGGARRMGRTGGHRPPAALYPQPRATLSGPPAGARGRRPHRRPARPRHPHRRPHRTTRTTQVLPRRKRLLLAMRLRRTAHRALGADPAARRAVLPQRQTAARRPGRLHRQRLPAPGHAALAASPAHA